MKFTILIFLISVGSSFGFSQVRENDAGSIVPQTTIKFRHKGQDFEKLKRCKRQVYCPKCYYRTCNYCWNYCPTSYGNNQVRCPCSTRTTLRPTTIWSTPYTRPRGIYRFFCDYSFIIYNKKVKYLGRNRKEER